MSAPMSSSALGPLTAPSSQKGSAASGSSRRASACSSRGPLTARRPIRVRRPAVRRGACGPEPAIRSRRWCSGSVGPPNLGSGCPELVKPILLTDIGVCMSQHLVPGVMRSRLPKKSWFDRKLTLVSWKMSETKNAREVLKSWFPSLHVVCTHLAALDLRESKP